MTAAISNFTIMVIAALCLSLGMSYKGQQGDNLFWWWIIVATIVLIIIVAAGNGISRLP